MTGNVEFRQSAIAAIDVYSSTFDRTHRDFYRAKSVMFYIFQMELLSQFSWAGLHFQSRGGAKKTAFRHFIGIIELVRASLNFGRTSDQKISDLNLVKGIKDALKSKFDRFSNSESFLNDFFQELPTSSDKSASNLARRSPHLMTSITCNM